jgi:hypothetical protein
MASSRLKHLRLIIPAGVLLLVAVSCDDKGTDPPINNAPRITSGSSVQAVIDELFSYTATATDSDGDPVTIEISNIPSWTELSGNTVSGTPNAQTPDTSFTVVASDGSLADTATVTVLVVESIPTISYSTQIQPIFNSNCGGSQCHIGGTASGLSLANYSSLMQGGNSGAVVLPGNPDGSIIVRRLEGDIQPQMPFQRQPLPPAQIQLIRDWIAEGAHDN